MMYAAELAANELENAQKFGKRTNGRQRIIDDGLEISQIAKRIIKWYETAM